jgi:hypothetical protein
MKQSIYFSLKTFIVGVIALTFVQVSAKAQEVHFRTSTVVPAAEGTVKVSYNKDKGHNIDISILHLASPQRLQPAAKTYIVWMDTEQNGTKNLGEIQSEDGFLSKTLKASLKTTTPFKPTRIFITAEDVAAISNPQGQQILTTRTFNR